MSANKKILASLPTESTKQEARESTEVKALAANAANSALTSSVVEDPQTQPRMITEHSARCVSTENYQVLPQISSPFKKENIMYNSQSQLARESQYASLQAQTRSPLLYHHKLLL